MSEELKCPSCGHGRVLHDLFRGCMQFNCSCTRNKEQVDTLLLISERNALRLQLESVNNENAYLHKQVEVAIKRINETTIEFHQALEHMDWGASALTGEDITIINEFPSKNRDALAEIARLEEAKNG